MKTPIHSWMARSLALGITLFVGAPAFSQAPNIKPPPKEAPKVPKVPLKIVEQPKVPKDVPKIAVPPKVVTPKNVPKIVGAPKTVNVPKVVVAPKIPTIKEPPKAPKIPAIVKVPDAPKVPKTPVLVKIPDAPKVPKNTPKIPTIVSIPDGKGPGVPKDAPKVPKVPVVSNETKVPKAIANAGKNGPPAIISLAKTPKTSSSPVVIAKKIVEVPQTVGNSAGKNNATEATVQEALAIIRGNRRNTDPGGPKSDLPAVERPSKDLPGVPGSDDGSGNALQDSLGILQGTGKDSQTSLLAGVRTNNKPPVDHGFGDKSKSIDPSAGAGFGGNPLSALTGDDQKSGGTGPGGVAGQGKDAISADPDGGSTGTGGAILQNGLNAITHTGPVVTGKENPFAKQGDENLKQGLAGDRNLRKEQMDAALAEGGTPPAAPAKEPAAAPTPPVASTEPSKKSSDGRNEVFTDPQGVKHVYVDGKKVGTIAPDGTVTPTTGRPREDATDPAAFAKFLQDNPALARQIAASKSGGSGNIDVGNADNTTTSGPRNGVVVPDSGTTARNLFGQPGQRGGISEGGAGNGGGINFNNTRFGAIDLGPDQTVTAGTRKQNEADAAPGSGQPLQDFPPNRATPDDDSGKPPADPSALDPSALAKFLRENPDIAEQIVASRSVQVPKAPTKKK